MATIDVRVSVLVMMYRSPREGAHVGTGAAGH